jgi:glutaconate CoA-transferase subunit B
MTTITTESSVATTDELITVTAARDLAQKRVVFAGIGLPTLSVSLAQSTVAPQLEVVYESGVCGAHPSELPATIADSVLITGSEAVLSLSGLFGFVLQGGRIDVGFLGAAQIDRWGNLNSSVIGTWEHPRKRLPGSGGAHEVLVNARETFVIMRRHSTRSLVDVLDFCTSAGPDSARAAGARHAARGVTRVFTELGVLGRTGPGEELKLIGLHAGISVDDVIAATGWDLQVSPDLRSIPAPTAAELDLLRDDIDPQRVYLRS